MVSPDKSEYDMKDEEQYTKGNKVALVVVWIIVIFAASGLISILYINSGYRNAVGTFGYKITYNDRKYEFKTSSKSLDIIQIRDLASAESDCYVYVGEYDATQDLQATLDIVNKTDKTNYQFMNTKIGSKDYPAIFVSFMNDKGGYAHMYFVDYNGHNLVISTASDKAHQKDIDKMIDSFVIIE